VVPDLEYPKLSGIVIERSPADRRCRCALYQEMVVLYSTFQEINKRNVNNYKIPIDLVLYT